MTTELNGYKRPIQLAASAAVAAAVATGLVTLDLPPWLREMTQQYGPGFLMIAAVFGGIAYYVPRDAVPKFLSNHERQAAELGGIKEQMRVIAGQGGQLSEIKEALSEILTHQKVIGERLKSIELRDDRRADDT